MPEPTAPGTPPAAEPTAPAESTAPVEPAAEPLDAEVANRELAEARKDAARYRAELKKVQDVQKAADEAKLSEEEKRTARIAELEKTVAERETALRDKSGYAAVVDAAARLGAAKPAMLHRLIERDIEFDDAGAPANVDTLVRDFLKSNPEFMSTAGRPTGDAGQGARGKSTMTAADLKKMKPEEINRLFDSGELAEIMARRSN